MLIDCKGKYGKFLLLGVQTNKGNTYDEAIKQCLAWKPKNAKSFNMNITHTDYEGRPVENETGFANVKVSYFSTKTEGKIQINT